MTILTETRERLLLAIVKEVPADQIAEIHFFQPIKQAGVESGVAVVAVSSVGVSSVETDAVPLETRRSRLDAGSLDTRCTVYTARYLLTLKGADRGKWEASVVPEADAPLETVDTVVRGVQRRSGDADAAERMSGDEVRALVADRGPGG